MLRRFRGVLIDLWGTLIYPSISIERYRDIRSKCLFDVLRNYGYDFDLNVVRESLVRARKIWDNIRYNSLREIRVEMEVVLLLSFLGVSDIEFKLVDDLVKAYMYPYINYVSLIEGAKEFLEMIHDKGFNTCLVSNTMDGIASRIVLDKLGISRYIKNYVFSDEVGWRKPHRRIFLEALMKLKLSPGHVVMIGDEKCDIEGAKRHGIFSIHFARYSKVKLDSDYNTTNYRDLIRFFDEMT